MSVDTRTAFERRQPSVDLRAFLDPLKPGEYFDCGGARLYGIDEALEAEALRRGRAVGDDRFQLVATDGGLIFCRASIMFAIAARWKDLTIGRPEDETASGEIILPISWPTHGDLRFTVSRRLGSNIFRRWLQLQAQATRRSQVEQDARFERTTSSESSPSNGAPHRGVNGHRGDESPNEQPPGRNGFSDRVDVDGSDGAATVDLRVTVSPGGNPSNGASEVGEVESCTADESGSGRNGSKSDRSIVPLDQSDRGAIRYATERERRRRSRADGDIEFASAVGRSGPVVDPLATIDAAVVDDWVDDRVPHAANTHEVAARGLHRPESTIFEDDPTADPFNGHEPDRDANRLDARSARPILRSPLEVGHQDATATHFMPRTVDGTDIFRGGEAARDAEGFGRSADPVGRNGTAGGGRRRNRHVAVPVPEISGARLHNARSAGSVAGPRLDIRSTLLSGPRESEWVEVLRERQVLILGLVTVVALVLIALIGFLAGDGGGPGDTVAVTSTPATADAGADTGAVPLGAGRAAGDEQATGTSTTVAPSVAGDVATIDSTAPTLRVSSTSVQICHSNYGGCVPVAADVDCEGDGDGPAFQATPVAVFGDDVYDLDTDDDREACEPDQPRLDASAGDG